MELAMIDDYNMMTSYIFWYIHNEAYICLEMK